MPTLSLPVPEDYASITRPVAMGIVKSVVQMTGLPIDRIMYNGHAEVDKDIESLIGEGRSNHALVRPGSTTRIEVTVNEKFDENYLLSTPVHQNDALSLFQDNALGVTIRPIYSRMDVTIEFSIRTEDLRTATSWLNDQKIRFTQMRNEHVHDIPFKYPIPKEYIHILSEIHKLRESQAGYGDTWDEWFLPRLTQKATKLSMMNGQSPLLVISEVAESIIGWWEFTDVPEHTKGEMGSTRLITFTYKYQYQKPTHVSMVYPLSIHNQMLDLRYIGPEEYTRFGFLEGDKSLIVRSMMTFIQQGMYFDYMLHGIRIPYFDEWYPFVVPRATATIASVLTRIDSSDLRVILDLNDLLAFQVRQEMLDYFQKYASRVTLSRMNPFIITLYKNGERQPEESIVLGDDLVLRSTADLNLRAQYHVRIGMLLDWTTLTEIAIDEIRHEPEICHELLLALDPTLADRGLLPKVLGGRMISRRGLMDAIRGISRSVDYIKRSANAIYPLVNNILITAENKRALI